MFIIGHPVYKGNNSYKEVANYKEALKELTSRGCNPLEAIRVMNTLIEDYLYYGVVQYNTCWANKDVVEIKYTKYLNPWK
jgi:hypothetical protein